MNANARKLMRALGIDYASALKLVDAGLLTENRAKNADKSTLTKLVGKEQADKIKGG